MIDASVYQKLTDESMADYYQSHNGSWRVYPRGSLGSSGIPASPEKPYVMYGNNNANQFQAVRESGVILNSYYDIYVYDEPGSYQRIKDIHLNLITLLQSLKETATSDGVYIMEFVFNNLGPDGYDTVNKQAAKVASYKTVAKFL